MRVKFNLDPLRFGGVILEKPILSNITYYAVMHDSVQSRWRNDDHCSF